MNHYIYFNFEKKIDDFSMPIIEYEVYSLINNKSLDLNYYKDKKIDRLKFVEYLFQYKLMKIICLNTIYLMIIILINAILILLILEQILF